MNVDKQQLYNDCLEEPSLIFNLIKNGIFEVVEELIDNNKINVNMVDSVGNDIVMRLLKAKQYQLVIKLMKKRNWDVNHQNLEGNTLGHILARDNGVMALKIVEELVHKKNYLPNIKNNKGETALDRAINNNYLSTAFKILEDKRFDSITLVSFKNLLNVCIKNSYYGKYSKLNNLKIIIESLEQKNLVPSLKKIVDEITANIDLIKNELMNNKSSILESIVYNELETA